MKSTPHALVVLGVLAAVQVAASEIKTILHFSDVHLNVSATDKESNLMPIRYGDDATISLLESSLKYAKKVIPNPDFFLYTGDHVVHGDLSDKYVASTVQKNVETLAKYYPPTKEQLDITAIIGNTDGSKFIYVSLSYWNTS
jgi:sphingomyelin phosphodiesterase acid-like 3